MTLRRGRLLLLAIFLFLVATRFAHMRIVWVEEAYPAAAAIQMLDSGNALYRDIWFDKPGGTVLLYMLWGARTGIPLRLAGAVFIFACCFLIYRFGVALWGRGSASATQPAAGPLNEKALRNCAPDIWRTEAMARIGEACDMRRKISRSAGTGTR